MSQSMRPHTPVASSHRKASGAGSVWSRDQVSDSGGSPSHSASAASTAGRTHGRTDRCSPRGSSQVEPVDLGGSRPEEGAMHAGERLTHDPLLHVRPAIELATVDEGEQGEWQPFDDRDQVPRVGRARAPDQRPRPRPAARRTGRHEAPMGVGGHRLGDPALRSVETIHVREFMPPTCGLATGAIRPQSRTSDSTTADVDGTAHPLCGSPRVGWVRQARRRPAILRGYPSDTGSRTSEEPRPSGSLTAIRNESRRT